MKSLTPTLVLPLLIALAASFDGTTSATALRMPPQASQGAPISVSFKGSAERVEAYDFVEVTVNVSGPSARNAFTDATVRGSFEKLGGTGRKTVDGFCDSVDGSVFGIRFMPSSPGDYTYTVALRQGDHEKTHTQGGCSV